MMMAIYWLYERDGKFLIALKIEDEVNCYTDVESLKKALESVKWLITYGDFAPLALLLSEGKSKYLNQYLLMDLSQELKGGTIDEIGYVNHFDLQAQTIEEYCLKRVFICEFLFREREAYFENKLEIINEFELKPNSIAKTRAGIASDVLSAVKQPNRPDVLFFDISNQIPKNELPKRLFDFYDGIKENYKNTNNQELVKNKFKMTVAGLDHTYGFGGVHAAKENYQSTGLFLHIDVQSFFTSIMVENQFISRAIREKRRVKELHNKKVIEGKDTYKVLINAIVGSMNNPYSKLYDPRMFFSITVSGQIMITHLILILKDFIEELIQTNTDGILVKIHPEFEELVIELSEAWAKYYNMSVKVTKFNQIIQKNVNNFLFVKENGQLIKSGIYKENTFKGSCIPAVQKAAIAYQTEQIKPQDFLVELFKNGPIEDFYFIGSKSKDNDDLVHELSTYNNSLLKKSSNANTKFKKTNDTVCGIATNNKKMGSVYQRKKGLHSKLPGCPDNFMSHTKATKKDINLGWYVEQVERIVF